MEVTDERTTHLLGIGAPRSGTTWLYRALRTHPKVYLPPIKELRHFLANRTARQQLATYRLMIRDPSLSSADRQFLVRWKKYDSASDEQYRDLFAPIKQPVRGEMSPAYCRADEVLIRRIQSVLGGNLKAILLLRNPIERDWSHAVFHLRVRPKNAQPISLKMYKAFVTQDWLRRCSDYALTIRLWREALGDRLFVGVTDEIDAQPLPLMRRIMEFLQIEFQPKRFASTLSTKVNTAEKADTDREIRAQLLPLLAELNLPRLRELKQLFSDPHIDGWLDQCEQIRAATPAKLSIWPWSNPNPPKDVISTNET
jgi:Sulfotransferase family